jgi:hypothetical protein
LGADGRAEKQDEKRREKREREFGTGGAWENVSPGMNWTRKGHAVARLKQKTPEEQDRQDDRNSDDDDLYDTHDLNLKFAGGRSYSLARAVFYRCVTRSVNVAAGPGLPRA